MDKVLKHPPFSIAYLNNIIIYSKTAEGHLHHLPQGFHKLCNAKLSMELSKCHFFTEEIQYLGHVLSTTGIKPYPQKQKPLNSCDHQKCQTSMSFPWPCRQLPKVHQEFCSNHINPLQLLYVTTQNLTGCQITKWHLSAWSTRTHTMLSIPFGRTHSLCRCLRWHLWCLTITGTQWSRFTSHVSFTHIHRLSAKMEHSKTRGL